MADPLHAGPVVAPSGGRWDLAELMSVLAHAAHPEVGFTETKTLSILKQPLKSSGRLSFTPPSGLEKHVTAPVEEFYRVDGEVLTVERPAEGLQQRLQLVDYPALQAFVESLRSPLVGDLATLQRFYQVHLGGSRQHWLLALAPRNADMAAMVRSVRIKGADSRIQEITIEEASGDLTVTRIEWPH